MSVWAAVSALAGMLVVAFGPGAAMLAAAGLRGLALAALAPAVTTALFGAAAVLAGLLGVPWSWPAALAAIVLAGGAALLVRRWGGPASALQLPRGDRRAAVAAWCGAGAAALLAALPMRTGMGGARSAPRTPDAVLHHGVLDSIAETGQASVLTVVRVAGTGDGPSVTRPGGWHDVVSVVMSLTGADAVVAANVSALVLAGLVVPLGVGYAAAVLLPRWRWAAPVGMLAGTAFVSLPTLVVSFGTLWPYAWATGLLPAVLAALTLRLRSTGRTVTSLAVLALAVAGVAATHYLGLFSLGLLALPLVLAAAVQRWRRLFDAGAGRRAGIEAVGAAVVAVAALVVDVLITRDRPPAPPRILSSAQATGEALLDTPVSEQPFGVVSPAWFLGALVCVGVLVALRAAGLRAWALSWGLAVAVYAIASSAPPVHLARRAVTSWWFDDPVRLATLIPIVAAPLVVVALDALRRALAALPRATARPGPAFGVLCMVAVTLLSLERADVRRDRMWFDYAPLPAASEPDAAGTD